MSEPATEHAGGPVTPQPPHRFELWLGPNRLHSVSGRISYRDNSACGRSNRLSSTRQNGSGISNAFSVSGNNVLDWTSVFFRWGFDSPLRNRRSNSTLVGHLDND
jgi:hypothetical protein